MPPARSQIRFSPYSNKRPVTPRQHVSAVWADMGRQSVHESNHFVRLEKTPNKQRYKVKCKYCSAAGVPIKKFTGRPENYRAHLMKCKHYKVTLLQSQTELPVDSPDSTPREWKPQEIGQFHRLLTAYQHRHRLPDSFIECDETHALYEFFRSGVSDRLPCRKRLGGVILREQAQLAQIQAETRLKARCAESCGRVNILSDVWQNVSKEHLLGSQISLFGCVMTDSLTEVGADHDGISIARDLEGLIVDASDNGWIVGALVTDDAGQCAKARRILALRWTPVVFLRCFAHDINNLVKQVLQSAYRRITYEAAAVVNALNASSSKWLLHLRGIMKRKYGKSRALITLCETRWNSMQGCFASLLRARSALDLLCCEFGDTPGFPSTVNAIRAPGFWEDLAEVERIIRPLSAASYHLQRNENTLADVVSSFCNIYRNFSTSTRLSRKLVACVEKRWANCEQPLFMLALYLHPKYVEAAKTLQDSDVSGISCIQHFAIYYYRRLIGPDTGRLRDEVRFWLTGKYTFIKPSETENPVPSFWIDVDGDHRNQGCKLPELALVVLSIAVNTAPCERLFSELKNIHTPIRNRMRASKSRDIQSIREQSRQAYASKKSSKRNRIIDVGEKDQASDDEEENTNDRLPIRSALFQADSVATEVEASEDVSAVDEDDIGDELLVEVETSKATCDDEARDDAFDTVQFWDDF